MVYKFQHSFFLALLFCRKYDSFFLVLIFFCKHGKKLSTYMYHNNLIKHLYRSNKGYSRNKCIGGSEGSAIKIWCPVGVKSVWKLSMLGHETGDNSRRTTLPVSRKLPWSRLTDTKFMIFYLHEVLFHWHVDFTFL
jgi:hypothetical protein